MTRCLDTRAFYVSASPCPSRCRMGCVIRPRSSLATRPYLRRRTDRRADVEDVDGDGRILSMHPGRQRQLRAAHRAAPDGAARARKWASSTTASCRGTVRNYDGFPAQRSAKIARAGPQPQPRRLASGVPNKWGLGLPHLRTGGACGGALHHQPYQHFAGGVTFRTWSGVLLRHMPITGFEKMAPEDLWVLPGPGQKGHRAHGLRHHQHL